MITQIQLNNFRNYDNKKFATPAEIVVWHGNNGVGKTNVLEAVSLFAYGRGLRRAKFDSMIRKDGAKNFWNIFIKTDGYKFSSGYVLEGTAGKRIFRVEEKQTKGLSEFAKNNYILWLTYETDRLFLQSPAERRSFIDMLCFCSSETKAKNHAENILNYEKLTKERQKILKQYYEGNQKNDLLSWLEIVETKIAKLGIEISQNRIRIVDGLEKNQLKKEGSLKFKTKMSGFLEDSIAHNCDIYRSELLARRHKDFFTKMTTVGPNRSDWNVFHLANNLDVSVCSAGEQKMLLTDIFLAFVVDKLRTDPRNLILLLDDVVAHLDWQRRKLLFGCLKDIVKKNTGRVNVWLTGTEDELFAELKDCALFIDVENKLTERE